MSSDAIESPKQNNLTDEALHAGRTLTVQYFEGQIDINTINATTDGLQPAVAMWKLRLEYFEQELALATDPAVRFALLFKIEEALRNIQRLGGILLDNEEEEAPAEIYAAKIQYLKYLLGLKPDDPIATTLNASITEAHQNMTRLTKSE